MPKTFDAALNTLIDAHLTDWAAFLAARGGVPAGAATPLDTDLSATLQADRLFKIGGGVPAAVHLELESTGRLGIPDELLRYNVAARAATGLPVHSVLVLLRPKANATDLDSPHVVLGADDLPMITFRYSVVRVWRESVAGLLGAGLGLSPLAMLTDEAAADLPAAFAEFQDRLNRDDVAANVGKALYGSTFVLCGLRYSRDQVESLYRELSMTLEDSTTYQLILERGEARGEARGAVAASHRILLAQGRKRFGQPPEAVEAVVRGVTDRDRLDRMAERLLDAAGWDDLLTTP